jgi:hypothetical protein
MSDVFIKFAALRDTYPDDIEQIDAEQRRVSELLKLQEYSLQPGTQALLAHCRQAIVAARLKLATERTLTDEQRAELWHIIDARQWFIAMVVKDYGAELSNIEQQLEADLTP